MLGSEPQIYFYSKRKAATGYVYTYALMEPHKFAVQMQKEMISEIESFSPSYIVFTNIPTSWLVRPNSEKLLLDWMESYIPGRYELSGFVDLISKDSIVYKWEDEIKGYSPRSKLNVYIFRKKIPLRIIEQKTRLWQSLFPRIERLSSCGIYCQSIKKSFRGVWTKGNRSSGQKI